jgi:hypothetical protein
MLALDLIPLELASARLTAGLSGSEWFEFDVALAPAMNLRFAPDGRSFPARGTVSIRRGVDHAASGEPIVDSFRYIESSTDHDTGGHVQERFGVTLFMAEDAFDRLTGRAQWGLPALVLYFDASSQVITPQAGGKAEDLGFRPQPQPWERIVGATLTQRLRPLAG